MKHFVAISSLAGFAMFAQPVSSFGQIQPGDILISNHTGNNVQLLRPSTGVVSTLVTVPGTPIGLAFDTKGILYINVGNGVMRYDPAANALTNFFTGNGQREGLGFDRESGKLFSVSFGSNLIEVLNLQGRLLQTITIPGSTQLLGVNARGGQLAVTDFGSGNVYIGPTTGTSFKLIGNVNAGNTYAPAIDIAGNIFVNDFGRGQTFKFTPAPGGTYTKSVFISGLSSPDNGLSIGPDGSFTISEFGANAVSIWNSDGTFRTRFPGVISPDELVVFNPPCANAGGDSDGDGLCDDWEKNGLTVMINGAPVFVDLPAMGADPKHKDIFVQADYMVSPGAAGHSHKPKKDAVAIVSQAFNNAPVMNPDGTTGIHFHLDCGSDCVMNPVTGATWGALSQSNSLAHVVDLGALMGGSYDWTAFAQIKAQNFPPARSPVFHYLIFAHNLGGLDGTSGISRGITASDFIVSLGSWDGQTGTTLQQAGTLMHELGHNLSLQHGGGDGINYKPNYLSIMSYAFQTAGLVFGGATGKFDYSRFLLPTLDESALNENVGLNGGAAIANYGTQYFCPAAAASTLVVNANGPIDWNCNGTIQANVSTAISNCGDPNQGCSAAPRVLNSFNDWSNLIYNGGSVGELGFSANLPMLTVVQQEVNPTIDSHITKPLAVAVTGGGAPQLLAGGTATLTFTITNTGANPDSYSLTPSATLNWADFTQVPASVSLAPGAVSTVDIPVHVPGSTAVGAEAVITLKATSQTTPSVMDSSESSVTVVNSGQPVIVAAIAGHSTEGGVLTLSLQITNKGAGPADNLTLKLVPVKTIGGTGAATLTSPQLPQNLGGLAVGGSTTITLTFNVPATATRLAIGESGTVQDLSGVVYAFSIGQTVNP